jgi:hypothetical protein
MAEILAPTLQAGIGIFGITSLCSVLAFVYFIHRTKEVAQQWSHKSGEYRIKMSRSVWIYYASIFTALGATLLYALQYMSQGFAVKPDMTIIVWMRWLFFSVQSYICMHVLTNVMAHQNDKPSKHEVVGGDGQAWAGVLTGTLSALFLYAGTVAQSLETAAAWASASLLAFLIALSTMFFPHDKLWGEDYLRVRDIVFSESSTWEVMTRSLPEKQRENSIVVWSFIYRFVLFLQWALSYAGMLITWFLADGNYFSTVLDLHKTLICFLAFDSLFIVPFQFLFIILTFANAVKKITAENTETGTVHYAAVQQHESL